MREVRGNLWTYPAELCCVTTNGIVSGGTAVMGAGCAREARTYFPGIDAELGAAITARGNRVHLLRHDLASFPTKHDYRDASDPVLIAASCRQLTALVTALGYHSVVLPRPGCGLGKLSWEGVVRPLLLEYWQHDPRFIVVSL